MLVVKAPKEYILAAKLKSSLKLYLVPVSVENQVTYALVTAFFDDEDEPLVLKTPLFQDDFSEDLFYLFDRRSIHVHFFDELSRELLNYRATVVVPNETRHKIENILLMGFSFPRARVMMDQIGASFGLRTAVDDSQAISICLNESVYPEDIFIQDTRPERHSYHGSRGYSHTVLEREEPGAYQEEDIVQCLLLVFPPEQIYLSPRRIYDEEEMCDILVVTDDNVLAIQAKDSPNIERISQQKLQRKRKNVLSALKKATDQVKGAVSYYRSTEGKLEFFIKGELHSVDTTALQVKTLVVVKELFSDQYSDYSPLLLDIYRDKDVPCIALDYPEFHQFCANLQDEGEFFKVYHTLMDHALETGEYPRPRFGLVEG